MKKASSTILTIQVIFMYLIHFIVYLICILGSKEYSVDTLFYVLLALIIAMFPIGFVSIIIAIVGALNRNEDTITPTIVAKVVLIPWYIANFVICGLICVGFLNPFLMLAIPIVIAIAVSLTFASMLLTSIHSLSRLIRLIANKEVVISNRVILATVFHFIFCLDLFGAIMLRKITSK